MTCVSVRLYACLAICVARVQLACRLSSRIERSMSGCDVVRLMQVDRARCGTLVSVLAEFVWRMLSVCYVIGGCFLVS